MIELEGNEAVGDSVWFLNDETCGVLLDVLGRDDLVSVK